VIASSATKPKVQASADFCASAVFGDVLVRQSAGCPPAMGLDADPAIEPCHDLGSEVIGDCLSPDALVWAEGMASPLQLQHVKPHMRLLTVDPTPCPALAFASVARVTAMSDGAEQRWVRVRLVDGSEVLMTADHPVWPQRTETSSGEPPVGPLRAEDLVSKVDSLHVLAARPIAVQGVSPVARNDAPTTRVQIELQNEGCSPWAVSNTMLPPQRQRRRALLIAGSAAPPPDTGGSPFTFGGQFVAVGDSSTTPAPNRFDALETRCLGEPTHSSALADQDTISETTQGSYSSLSQSRSSSVRQAHVVHHAALVGGTTESPSASSASSPCPSSAASTTDEDVDVMLGGHDELSAWTRAGTPDGTWRRDTTVSVSNLGRAVRLSDILKLPRAIGGDRLSFGSIGHVVHHEPCKVCVFNRKKGTLCRYGSLCTFCHAWHQPYVRPRRPDKRYINRDQLGRFVGKGRGSYREEDRDVRSSDSGKQTWSTASVHSGSSGSAMGGRMARPQEFEPWFVPVDFPFTFGGAHHPRGDGNGCSGYAASVSSDGNSSASNSLSDRFRL